MTKGNFFRPRMQRNCPRKVTAFQLWDTQAMANVTPQLENYQTSTIFHDDSIHPFAPNSSHLKNCSIIPILNSPTSDKVASQFEQ